METDCGGRDKKKEAAKEEEIKGEGAALQFPHVRSPALIPSTAG